MLLAIIGRFLAEWNGKKEMTNKQKSVSITSREKVKFNPTETDSSICDEIMIFRILFTSFCSISDTHRTIFPNFVGIIYPMVWHHTVTSFVALCATGDEGDK